MKIDGPNLPGKSGASGVPVVFKIMLALACLRGPASAQSVSVSPGSGPGNILASVTASGFQPNQDGIYANTGFYVDEGFRDRCLGPSDGAGWANCTVVIAMPTSVGPHTIRAGNSFGQQVTTTYTVDPPTLTVAPAFGPPGTQMTVSGRTFVANGNVGVYIDDGFTRNEVTDHSGNFSDAITFSSMVNGAHVVKGSAGGAEATAPFTVTNCVGSLVDQNGDGTLRHPGGDPQPVPRGAPAPLQNGDTVHSGPGGTLPLNLIDGTAITLGPGSAVTVDNYNYDASDGANNSATYRFLQGAFSYLSGLLSKNHDADVRVQTLVGGIGIRGTQFITRLDPCSLTQEIYLIEGTLAVSPAALPGVTNTLQAPVSIFLTSNSVVTNALTAALFQSISNQVFITNTIVTLGSWLTAHFGCTNNNAAATPEADPDGDGANNASEFLAHTDPADPASVFHLLSAVPEAGGTRVTWTCGHGRTNVLQSAASLNASWSNVSGNLFLQGAGDVTTNFLDAGAINGANAKFYRVQLVQ